MTRRKRYSEEFEREALRRANEQGVTDVLAAEALEINARLEKQTFTKTARLIDSITSLAQSRGKLDSRNARYVTAIESSKRIFIANISSPDGSTSDIDISGPLPQLISQFPLASAWTDPCDREDSTPSQLAPDSDNAIECPILTID